MIKPIRVGKNKWVAGTEDKWSGLHAISPVNRFEAPSPAPIRKRFRLKRKIKI